MRARPGPSARVAAAAVLIIGSGIGIGLSTATNAVATTDPPILVKKDAGVLRLHVSSGGPSITYTGPLTVPGSQAITVSPKCAVTTGGELLAFSTSGGSGGLGLVYNGLGVRSFNPCSLDSGQLSGNERLTLSLGSAFGPDVVVDSAELDVEGTAVIKAPKLGVSFDGRPATTIELTKPGFPNDLLWNNNRVALDQDFRSIKLSPVNGLISLHGGGDGTYAEYLAKGLVGPIGQSLGTADTILKLVTFTEYEDAVDCEETLEATLIGGSADSATLTRDLNDGTTDPDECEDVGATFEVTDDGVLLDKSTVGTGGTPQDVNASVQIVWAAQLAQVPLDARTINFEGDPDGVFEDVRFCAGIAPDGDVIHPPDPRFEGGVLPWCLVEDDVELLADGTVQQTQVYDGAGDPLWR